MTLPERINSDAALDDSLAEPSDSDLEFIFRLRGDVLILGAERRRWGRLLARRIQRAVKRTGRDSHVIAASAILVSGKRRHARDAKRGRHPDDRCDLLDPRQVGALPRCEHVLFWPAASSGHSIEPTSRGRPTRSRRRAWPSTFASRAWWCSRQAMYSLVPVGGPAPTEDDRPAPVGEYAQSCLGRERVIEFVSRQHAMPALIFRLNYAVDLRYGALVDIARRVFAGEPVDLAMGYFNAIWQGDANSYALGSLALCSTPPTILNVTGPERISVREIAGVVRPQTFGRSPRFANSEGPLALLSDSSRCRALLGNRRCLSPFCGNGWPTGCRAADRR